MQMLHDDIFCLEQTVGMNRRSLKSVHFESCVYRRIQMSAFVRWVCVGKLIAALSSAMRPSREREASALIAVKRQHNPVSSSREKGSISKHSEESYDQAL